MDEAGGDVTDWAGWMQPCGRPSEREKQSDRVVVVKIFLIEDYKKKCCRFQIDGAEERQELDLHRKTHKKAPRTSHYDGRRRSDSQKGEMHDSVEDSYLGKREA